MTEPPLRVLVISQIFPSPAEPTRGIYNGNRVRALAAHCEVRAICPERWLTRIRRGRSGLSTPEHRVLDIPTCYPVWWSVPGLAALHAAGMEASLRGLVREVRREFPFDAILAAWGYPDGVAAVRLGQELGVPVIIKLLGSDGNECPRRPLLRPQIRWALNRCHHVVTVSQALRDGVVALGVPPERVVAQQNGVDGERFRLQCRRAARERLGLPADKKLVCFVGNLRREKGVDILVDAAARLAAAGAPEFEVLMVGGGPREEQLQARIRELKLEAVVRLCGRRPNHEIADWIGAADLLCLPSFREGCPNVVLEALACGRPVVASRVGGVPELVTDQTGVLVPAGDADALAAGLHATLQREWDADALRNSVQYLSWDHYGTVLRNVIAGAVADRRQSGAGCLHSVPSGQAGGI